MEIPRQAEDTTRYMTIDCFCDEFSPHWSWKIACRYCHRSCFSK